MRELVAGAAGFLGCNLVRRLQALGSDVVAVDSLVTGRADLLPPGVELVQADVTEPLPLPRRFDRIWNLACPASPPAYMRAPFVTLFAGSDATRRLLERSEADGAVFVQVSTSEVYGDPLVHPQPEDYRGNVDPVGPRSVYDESKRFAEALTMAWHRHRGVSVRIPRVFNTYGPWQRPDDGRVVPSFVAAALRGEPLVVFGDGTQTRSFCYVDDLVDGLLALADSDLQTPVNLGNPQEVTITELAGLVLELTGGGSSLEFRSLPEQDPRVRCPDITLARNRLGWTPKIDLRTGLQRTVEWYVPRV